MKNPLLVSCVSIWALTILSGCGGGGGSCGNAAPCGGDIVGTWTVTSSCVTASAMDFAADCPTATSTGVGIKITGNVTYNANLTYMLTSTVSGKVAVTLPAACLTSPQGIVVTCPQLTQVLAADPTFTSASCVGAGSGCTCTVGLLEQSSTESGTYTTTAAGLLTETPAGGAPEQSDYCVKGNTLTDSPHAGASMMGGTVSGTVTLTKS